MAILPVPSSRARAMRRGSAFTLIELLLVIVIIGILAGVLLPVFANIQRKSKQITSMSNLKQWGAAMVASLSDFNNTLPWEGQPVTLSPTDVRGQTAWYNRLPPYMGLKALSAMQASQYPRAGQNSVWVNPAVPLSSNTQYPPPLFCYAMNYYLSNGDFTNMPVAVISHPSATVFLMESGDNFGNTGPQYVQAFFGAENVLTGPDNGANFLFCDGHVALLARRDFGSAAAINAVTPSTSFTFVPYPNASH